MKGSLSVAALLGMNIAQPVLAQEDAARHFVPSTDWALDYGEDYCRLMRGFSNGEDELTLALDRIQPGPVVRMMVSGSVLSTGRRARSMGVRFDADNDARQVPILKADGANGTAVYNLGDLYVAPVAASRTREDQRALRSRYSRTEEAAFGKSIESISFEGIADPIVLDTGELGGPVEALQACADELVTYWELDIDKRRNARRPVVPANDVLYWLWWKTEIRDENEPKS